MKKFLQILLTIGISFTTQSVLSISAQAGIELKPNLAQSPTQNSKVKQFTFDFKNTYDYATCLDIILLAYEKRSVELEKAFKNDCANNVLQTFGNTLSKDVALGLVESANLYATEKLATPLYPSLGLRRRIAINLGYVYPTDKKNPDILKYINPES
ncbi:hypothetical protein C7B62_14830 [Pleurocapsa sp. CCALA 161]|uniref:hypothetical protein n=1 Tax=Pleurocapsa sp. CCALA 161 TaxID=2107688 RepID=UPI000D063EFB|nr:hypothetical protein [Pleurocapsa sp. CCALA 161]PSB08985.1 hypothetical protein C7B62_14830 [Pleurocapsa sp. CCALA 161]